MKTIQRLFDSSKHFPSFILSRLTVGKAIGVLLLAVVAIALGLANPRLTSSAVVKNTEKSVLQEPSCTAVPPVDCAPNPNGEGLICCTNESNGDRTCHFESDSCQTFDNPCDPDNPVTVFVRTTLVSHNHTDAHGGRHYHTHLEMHGMPPTPGQCTTDLSAGRSNKDVGGDRFAFVKASTTSQDEIFNVVRNSSFNSSGPPPENFSDPFTLHIITRGGAANFTVREVLHMTQNANGEMTACVSRESASCQGSGQ
jgi:hypothetical protein